MCLCCYGRKQTMDFSISLASGQCVLLIHFGADGAESKETLSCVERFNSCVGLTGSVCVMASSKLGTGYTFLMSFMFCCITVTFDKKDVNNCLLFIVMLHGRVIVFHDSLFCQI